MRIRTKTVDKEAVQLTWENWSQICEFVPKPWFNRGTWLDEFGFPLPENKWRFGTNNDDLGLLINTSEGTMLARGNDWIIKGVNGEFYACKPDVFEKTYDILPDLPPAASDAGDNDAIGAARKDKEDGN